MAANSPGQLHIHRLKKKVMVYSFSTKCCRLKAIFTTVMGDGDTVLVRQESHQIAVLIHIIGHAYLIFVCLHYYLR